MKQVRIKKKCNNCLYLIGFPYVHCNLGCKLKMNNKDKVFDPEPKDKHDCKYKRQIHLYEKSKQKSNNNE